MQRKDIKLYRQMKEKIPLELVSRTSKLLNPADIKVFAQESPAIPAPMMATSALTLSM
jgi:hypothetical protein